MPVRSVLLIEFLFDVLGYFVLDFDIVGCVFGLHKLSGTSLIASAFMSLVSGISTMVYFL
jgi:hypothetical protein